MIIYLLAENVTMIFLQKLILDCFHIVYATYVIIIISKKWKEY